MNLKGGLVSTTDIEKESLAAHVELCGERYKQLHNKLDAIMNHMKQQDETIDEIRHAVIKHDQFRNRQLLGWSTAIIGGLAAALSSALFVLFTS